jgi:hypothetical protein
MKNIPILVSPETMKRSQREVGQLRPAPHHIRMGAVRVLITCVHGYGHMRDGMLKLKDSGSFDTSHAIAVAADASWMAVAEEGAVDSNYHRDTPFKRTLAAYLEESGADLVVDIHTSNAFRPYDVEIGSMDQRSWLGHPHWRNALLQSLANSGFLVSDNQVFRAVGAHLDAETITSFCYQRGVPAVQLEISSALTDDLVTLQAMHANAKLVNAIAAVVANLPRAPATR